MSERTLPRVFLEPQTKISEQVRDEMAGRPDQIVVFALLPEDLGKAVGERTVFPGVRIEELESHIENKKPGGNQLHVEGLVNVFGNPIEFSGIIINTPQDKIAIAKSSPQFGRFSPLGVLLRPVLNNTDGLARTTMNAQFDGATVRRLHVGTEALEATVAGIGR